MTSSAMARIEVSVRSCAVEDVIDLAVMFLDERLVLVGDAFEGLDAIEAGGGYVGESVELLFGGHGVAYLEFTRGPKLV